MSTHTQQTISTGDDRSVSETVDSSGSAPLVVDPAGRSVDWSDSVEGGRACHADIREGSLVSGGMDR